MECKLSSLTEEDIDKCNDINNVLLNSVVNAGCFLPNAKPKQKKEKPWYNDKCRKARNGYYKTKNEYRNTKLEQGKAELVRGSKRYKKNLNCALHDYKKNIVKKLRHLKSTDPKQYWKILNNKTKANESEVLIEEFYKQFSKTAMEEDCNINSENVSSSDSNVNVLNGLENEFINRVFSVNEVKIVIQKLKNNKSPGMDNILNEFISFQMIK